MPNNLKEEKMEILKMIEDGRISSKDGLELLNSLEGKNEIIEEKHEKDITNVNDIELQFQAINGKILIKTWDEDKIYVDAFCQIKSKNFSSSDSIYLIYEDGNKIIFKPSCIDNLSTTLEIKIPDREYNKIELITTNGKIQASTINVKQLDCNTKNSTVNLSDIESSEINSSTKNGRTILKDVKSTNISLTTSNCPIDLQNIDCKDIKATTKNGKILLEDVVSDSILAKTSNSSIKVNDCSSKTIDTETSNGKINVYNIDTEKLNSLYMKTSNSSIETELNDDNRKFSIDAKTSMGNIDVEIANLVCDVNVQKHLGAKEILAHSVDFNEENDIKIIALTSNGSIKIK